MVFQLFVVPLHRIGLDVFTTGVTCKTEHSHLPIWVIVPSTLCPSSVRFCHCNTGLVRFFSLHGNYKLQRTLSWSIVEMLETYIWCQIKYKFHQYILDLIDNLSPQIIVATSILLWVNSFILLHSDVSWNQYVCVCLDVNDILWIQMSTDPFQETSASICYIKFVSSRQFNMQYFFLRRWSIRRPETSKIQWIYENQIVPAYLGYIYLLQLWQ